MLEAGPGTKITTAALAKEVVSEAALYRHFPSKAKCSRTTNFWKTISTRISLILSEELDVFQVRKNLAFTDYAFGKIRLYAYYDGMPSGTELRARIVQFFDRIETQLKQLLREGSATARILGCPLPIR